MGLTAEELSLLRDETQRWYPDLCNISRYVTADDPYGGRGDQVPDPILTDVKCMLDSGAGHEQTIGLLGSLATEAEYIVTLPVDVDIRIGDEITITTQNNLRLRVQAVLSPESFEIDRRVIANRLLAV